MTTRISPVAPLFHWAPSSVRSSIKKHGLKISQPNPRGEIRNSDGSLWFAPWICLGVSPSEAWAWGNLPLGEYDLWEIKRSPDDKVRLRKDGGSIVLEVRIHNDIPPDRLWLVGTRTRKRRYWQ